MGHGSAAATGETARHAAQRPRVRSATGSIPSLTGIRGIAAAYVFLTHAQGVVAAGFDAPWVGRSGFLRNGFRGVDLFFLLSGFILMHVHDKDFARLEAGPTWRFYVLRFFRVYPLNALILLVLLPMSLALPGFVGWTRWLDGAAIRYHDHDFSAAGFAQSLLLAQAFSVVKPGQWNGPAWSLSAEVFGYATFPLLARVALRCRSAALAAFCALASLSALVAATVACGHATGNPTGGFGLVRMAGCFVAGIALSRCFRCWPGGERWAAAATLVSLGWILLCLLWPPLNLLVLLGFGGIVLGLAYQRGPVDALLASRPALFLGRISFSFYMVHYVPLQLCLWLLGTRLLGSPGWLRGGLVLAVCGACVPLAMVLHRWFEVPCQRLARRALRPAGTAPGRAGQGAAAAGT